MLKTNKTYGVNLLSGLLTGAVIALASTMLTATTVHANETPSASECGQLPDVAWWSKSHEKVQKFVRNRHRGNWDSYVEKWTKYQTRMQKIYARDGSALIKSRDLKLEGETLAAHIKHITVRLDVIKCLAEEAELADIQRLANLDTASGGNFETAAREDNATPATDSDHQRVALLSPDQQLRTATASDSDYKIEIKAHCLDDGTRVFEVYNAGAKWPKLAAISIYETERMRVVSRRELRMTKDHHVTFTIPKTYGEQKQLAAWVQPSWMLRDFRYDAKLLCE